MRYGPGCSKADYEAENEREPVPNTPYATVPDSRFPIPYSRLPTPYSLLPTPT
ncbi:MAG: hypothetical protein F6J98_39345 [Moorea sp. SIO4G2]|uniref:hypothetical protein n=1 Tax=Moorena sp. SIO3E8 TaxID=2607830 RepID=UPI0013FC8693|nr:hypothetical protein [Moorena sp. SIO3E8]NEO16088.1 hypothetical protein [Moorena sp. SIO3E8]NEO66121.1 hypothetical protein [Moorena sp. SIO4G2]NEQ00987.1 hypothetical protein [Moorena sp. SIO3F7]